MNGLLGCCSSSTLMIRANDYVKPSLRSGFDCTFALLPRVAGRTTPWQPGHYPLRSILYKSRLTKLVFAVLYVSHLQTTFVTPFDRLHPCKKSVNTCMQQPIVY